MALIFHNSSYKKNEFENSLNNIIKSAINNDILSSFLLVVPTGKLTKYLKYNIIEEYYKKYNRPCGNVNIFNLEKFAEIIFDNLFQNNKLKKISAPYRLALIEEAAQNSELKFYKNNDKPFYYHIIERLSNIIYGLREDGITYESMFDDIEQNDNNLILKNKDKYSDIANIFKSYENIVKNKYIDPPLLLKELINFATNDLLNNSDNSFSFDKILKKLFPQLNQIAFYGFSEFKMPEVEFLSKFAISKIPISIHLDFSEINGPLFGNLADMKSILLTAGFNSYYTDNEIIEENKVNQISELNNSPKYFLRRWLFNVEKEIRYPFANTLNIYEFDNFDDEVKQISKLIKHLIVNKNYKASEIAVVSRDISLYSTKLRQRFYIDKIPANISDRFELRESQVIITILTIIETILNDFSVPSVINTLQSSFLNFTVDSRRIDVSNLIQTINELRFPKNNIKLSKKYWENKISNAINYLKKLDEDLEQSNTDSLDVKNLKKRIKNYEQALNDFKQFSELIPQKSKKYSPNEFRNFIVDDIIKKFLIKEIIRNIYLNNISEFNRKNKLHKDLEIESVEKYSRALSEFIKLIDEMIFIMNDRGAENQDLSQYYNKLKLIVSGSKYQVRDKQNYGVTVTSVEQIREIPYKVTILCGLNDGIFPKSYKPEYFLGKELHDSEDRHLHSEQIQFYQFLVNGLDEFDKFQKQIYLTYSKRKDNFEISRSSFVDSVLKVTDIEPVTFINNDEIEEKFTWYNSISNQIELSTYIAEKYINYDNFNLSEINSKFDIEKTNEYFKNLQLRYNNILNNLLIKFTDKLLPNNNVYSATDFEKFAKCSYQYFVNKILRIKEFDSISNTINALEFGNIMHSALYKFYTKLQEEQNNQFIYYSINSDYKVNEIRPVKLDKNDLSKYKLLLYSIIEKEFDDIKYEHPFLKLAKREIIGSDTTKGWAEQFIDSDIERSNQYEESYPSLFEFEFGLSNSIPPVKLADNLYLRGKVDRIEFLTDFKLNDTDDEAKLFFKVVDYKSSISGITNDKDIDDGINFQTALYIMALKEIFKEYYDIKPNPRGASYYILKPKIENGKKKDTFSVLMPYGKDYVKKTGQKNKIENFEIQQEYLDKSLNHALNIIKKISNAEFEAKPLKANTCQYCSFSPICRIKERQAIDFDSNENIEDE